MQSGTPGEDGAIVSGSDGRPAGNYGEQASPGGIRRQCTSPPAAVDTTAACDFQYHVGDAVSRFAVFASPYSWQCWN